MTLPPARRATLAILMAIVAALLTLGLAACGDDDDDASTDGATAAGAAALPAMTEATLILDFLPGGVHAGIYRAQAQGYYEANNIDLEIIQPTSTADTLKLIDAGKADFGIADGIDLANQIAEGRSAKAIAALVQVPLGGLIALEESGITDPAQLEGKTIGVTGVPSDNAIYQTIISSAGGDPSKAEVVTIGFNGVQTLETKRIDAFTGFWPSDAVQVAQDGFPTTVFRLDEHGGPAYPGLVIFSTEEKIASDPDLMAAFLDATVRGYDEAIADPDAALEDLLSEEPTLDRDLTKAILDTYVPLFQADAAAFGVMDTGVLEELSTFLVDTELIADPITPDRYGTNEFLPADE